jgi:NRPS condensation-like uncharacterized protein
LFWIKNAESAHEFQWLTPMKIAWVANSGAESGKEKASIACLKSLILLEKGFDILPYKTAKNILEKSFSNAPIAFTNIGILDRNRLSFGTSEIREAYMTGSIKYSPYFQMAISTYNNQATLWFLVFIRKLVKP